MATIKKVNAGEFKYLLEPDSIEKMAQSFLKFQYPWLTQMKVTEDFIYSENDVSDKLNRFVKFAILRGYVEFNPGYPKEVTLHKLDGLMDKYVSFYRHSQKSKDIIVVFYQDENHHFVAMAQDALYIDGRK